MQSLRLGYTPISRDNVDELHRHWTDPQVRRYLLDDLVVDRAWVEQEVRRSQAHFMHHDWGLWRMGLLDGGTFVGVCGFRTFFDPPEVQLVVSIEPAYVNQGLGREAARRMIDYAFDELGFDRVIGCTDAPNTASRRLMESCGMRLVRRETLDGIDTLCYQIARSDP